MSLVHNNKVLNPPENWGAGETLRRDVNDSVRKCECWIRNLPYGQPSVASVV